MRHIKHYKGLYSITKCGRVYNSQGQELSKMIRDGYPRVTLYKNGKRKVHSVHVLVADNYKRNPKKLPVINHKDSNRENSHADNLQYVTQSDNIKHSYKSGRKKSNKKYCEKVIDKAIRLRHNNGYSLREISKLLEVNLNTLKGWFRRL